MNSILEKAKKIKFILTDVDGVLTDGLLNFFPNHEGKMEEFKSFSAIDGLGTLIANRAGLTVGIITGRAHPSTVFRASSLGMKYIYQGYLNKLDALNDLCKKENITFEEIAFIGDDIIDLAVMSRIGLAVAPKDATPDVQKCAHYISVKNGGRGVLREVIEIVLKAQNKWDEQVKDITKNGMVKKKMPATVISTSDGVH